MPSITMDPVTRIEGHLAVRAEIENGRITAAYAAGEMFRGFEILLQGRDPLDAQHIVQRICGVCPISHGTASVLAQEQAAGFTPPTNGRLLRNLMLAANYLQSHILHFYHLSALDFVDIAAVAGYKGRDPVLRMLRDWIEAQNATQSLFPGAPFLPRYEGAYLKDNDLNCLAARHYVEALDIRAAAHKAAAIFAGKMPHAATLVPGGVTERVTADKIAAYGSLLAKVRTFVEETYVPDVLAVAGAFPDYFKLGKGPGSFLSFGAFSETDDSARRFMPAGVLSGGKAGAVSVERITEDVKYARFSSGSGLGPKAGETTPDPHKANAYTWLKAPRYGGEPMEVGPLARVMVAYQRGETPELTSAVDTVLKALNQPAEALNSVMGRHAARAIEAKLIAARATVWLDALTSEGATWGEARTPEQGVGAGLVEAPRGALGHWLEIRERKIARYQCVVPTTWNCSPRDDRGVPGPIEQALANTPIADPKNPIEAARIVRSFDPCLACAVH